MSSGVVRRRVHHEDVGGRKFEKIDAAGEDGSDEPLLLNDVRQPPRPSYVSTTTMRIIFSISFRVCSWLCYTVAEVIQISLVRFEAEWASKREVYVLHTRGSTITERVYFVFLGFLPVWCPLPKLKSPFTVWRTANILQVDFHLNLPI